jgi:hypothetical protein
VQICLDHFIAFPDDSML